MGEAPPKAKNFRIVNSPELDDGFESDMEAPAEDVLREEKARKSASASRRLRLRRAEGSTRNTPTPPSAQSFMSVWASLTKKRRSGL